MPESSSVDPLKICVMIVDDSPGDIALMRDALRKAAESLPELSVKLGFNVRDASTLEAAVTALKEESCDVVLLDLGLPPYGDVEAVTELKRHFPWMPLIVVSGNESERMAIEAVREGADDYLLKTEVSPKRIVRAVRYTLARAQKTGALTDTKNLERLTDIVKKLP